MTPFDICGRICKKVHKIIVICADLQRVISRKDDPLVADDKHILGILGALYSVTDKAVHIFKLIRFRHIVAYIPHKGFYFLVGNEILLNNYIFFQELIEICRTVTVDYLERAYLSVGHSL